MYKLRIIYNYHQWQNLLYELDTDLVILNVIKVSLIDVICRSMQVMYSLNKNKGCLLDQVVDVHSRQTMPPLPTTHGLDSITLRDARRNAMRRSWNTLP